jgi:hypothetical protein
MYINGILQDFPTLKEFTKDKFIGGNLYEYYDEFFKRLEIVDNIIDTLFNTGIYNISCVVMDLSSTEFERYLEKMTMIASTVYYRMQREHHILVDIQINYGYLEPIRIEYRLLMGPDQFHNMQYVKQNCPDRATGRTTRNINQYIQFAYQKWLSNDIIPIDLIDHFSYEMHMYDHHFMGRSISGPNNANHALVIKLKDRIYEEFPKSIFKFVQLGQYKLSYNLPRMKGIDYTKLE